MPKEDFHFDVSSGLKRVLGQELITDDEVAIFELVKNSFDAKASIVHIYYDGSEVVVADNGNGMSLGDIKNKWLFVAYSEKRIPSNNKNYRDQAYNRKQLAGSKGVGRFSSDRLGTSLSLQTRSKKASTKRINKISVDWDLFDKNDKAYFHDIPVEHSHSNQFDVPSFLKGKISRFRHGTVIRITKLREQWSRSNLIDLKLALAKLINPFGTDADKFKIYIHAPQEIQTDNEITASANENNTVIVDKDIVNGKINNFVFSELMSKTTFINVEIKDSLIFSSLTDRGQLVYSIKEPNNFPLLDKSNFKCDIFFLNHSAKTTFTRRVGLPSVQFGSIFLFRNGFRVYPIGEQTDDWFGFDRRKQQGHSRFLGTRDLIGRVDIVDYNGQFEEASSRNQGLIENQSVKQLRDCVMKFCMQRLEKYVVPVLWADKADKYSDDLSRIMTDPGKSRATKALATLVNDEKVELIEYNTELINLVNERSLEFESSIDNLKSIAKKLSDENLLKQINTAQKRYSELKHAETEARKIAEKERANAEKAQRKAAKYQKIAIEAKEETKSEKSRVHFLQNVVNLDTATILNLHHQAMIYSVDIQQQIENLIQENIVGKKSIPTHDLLKSIEQIAFLNNKIISITRFASKANFTLDSEKIETDLAGFINEYIENISKLSSSRLRIHVENTHPGFMVRFNPIDVSIIIENLISNSKKYRATRIQFNISKLDKNSLLIDVQDNGDGFSDNTDKKRIFEMGYTTSLGSGLGLYHVKQVLGEMAGSITIDESSGEGAKFRIKIAKGSS